MKNYEIKQANGDYPSRMENSLSLRGFPILALPNLK